MPLRMLGSPVAAAGSPTDVVQIVGEVVPPLVQEIVPPIATGTVVDTMASHIASGTPHTAYDDMQDLALLFENGMT